MTVPSFVAAGGLQAETATSIAPDIPATAQADDLLLAMHFSDAEPSTVTPPTGWTQIGTYQAVSAESTLSIWRAWCTTSGTNAPGASPSWTLSVSNERHLAQIAAVRGVPMSNPIDAFTQGNRSGTSFSLFPVTTTQAESLLIAFVNADNVASGETISTTDPHTQRWFHRESNGDLITWCITNPAVTVGTYNFAVTASVSRNFPNFLIALKSPTVYDQEGFRWRNDDGNETTATWAASQDTGITASSTATRRLRTIVNATGDPPALQYRLQYRRQGDPSTEWEDVQP